eukprot:TRINITY_DN8037_c3_g1_i1.p1 TRINITY_DN8037_c3_g1~~TRINITY_DN8037_c3_g1_i1.p1  ORF type:complete len:852 (-),score=411.08 TRINITY_DN8037_c3_g1_i1:39-2594(-)
MDFYTVLQQALSDDSQKRNQAEQILLNAQEVNFAGFLQTVATELANEQREPAFRRLAGVILKNSLVGKSIEKKNILAQKWLSIEAATRGQIKGIVISTLGSTVREARNQAAQVIARIALIELPVNQWPELIPSLLSNMTASPPLSEFIRQSTLETLGYICEEIPPDVVRDKVNLILTAIVQGMRKENGSVDVILAATNALINALEFIRVNFTNENERNYIMLVVCETAEFPDTRIRTTAFESLARIAMLYYEFLQPYMSKIFDLTINAIKNDSEDVALQAVEFWSSICEEEINITEENDNLEPDQQKPFFNLIKNVLKYLTPALLDSLKKQDENADEEDWNLAMAAGNCLSLIATTVGDEVVQQVLPFIQQNFTSTQWRECESAITAFGSIMEGVTTQTIAPIIAQAMPGLVQYLQNQNMMVRDTAVWTITKISINHPQVFEGVIQPIVTSLSNILSSEPRVAARVCWAFNNIAKQFFAYRLKNTSPFSSFFQGLCTLLITTSERDDDTGSNLRACAYEAINSLIENSALDVDNLLCDLCKHFIHKFETSFSKQILSNDDREDLFELQGLICGTFTVLTNRLEDKIVPFTDKILENCIKVLTNTMNVQEEALITLGAIANVIGKNFEPYLTPVMAIILSGLTSWQESNTCLMAVGVLSHIISAVSSSILPLSESIMKALFLAIQNTNLDKSLKPAIISCIGDIILVNGIKLDQYLNVIMQLITQASQTTVDLNDLDQVEYLNSLHTSVLETLTSIIQSLRETNTIQLFEQYSQFTLAFASHILINDKYNEETNKAAVGAIGDLASGLGNIPQIKSQLQNVQLMGYLDKLIKDDSLAADVAAWAISTIQKLN